MQESIPQIYDRNLKRLAFLENASQVGYKLELNALHTAQFTLPSQDEKNKLCQPMNFVEIYDGRRRIELFRIIGEDMERSTEAYTAYECEHVLATLLNDVLFQYHQIGGIGVFTSEVLRYVLDKQTTQYWQLGKCDFSRQFEYKWENTNLLSALFSVPNAFVDPYMWTFDTTARPWRINLVAQNAGIKTEIRYKKNMVGIRRTKDSSCLVTRLYPLGYGEGDNQLTIKDANGGLPYLDADTIPVYGLIQSVLIDRRFESSETLMAYAASMLEQLKMPYISYQATVADLARYGGAEYDQFALGDVTRVIDQADGISVDTPIVEIAKDDIRGAPQDIRITLANKSRSIASSIADLQNRALISESYAQGATNQMGVAFADNCDPTHPAVLNVYVPDTMARINRCVLHYEIEAFRSYSRGIEAAQSSVVSSSAGGGSTQTSTTNGATYGTTDYNASETAGTPTSAVVPRGDTLDVTIHAGGQHSHMVYGEESGETSFDGNHGHYATIDNHTHYSATSSHTHDIQIGGHAHSLTIPDHAHSMTIPSHNHAMEHGIYEGERANSIAIKVDGKAIPAGQNDIDITQYFAVDGAGRITRNAWHRIEVVPDKMTRINANVFFQIFTNSRGGGDY